MANGVNSDLIVAKKSQRKPITGNIELSIRLAKTVYPFLRQLRGRRSMKFGTVIIRRSSAESNFLFNVIIEMLNGRISTIGGHQLIQNHEKDEDALDYTVRQKWKTVCEMMKPYIISLERSQPIPNRIINQYWKEVASPCSYYSKQ